MTVFPVTRYKWMDNVICHHMLQTQCIWRFKFNVFRNLKMHKLVEKLILILHYISPYLSSITCGCVQNTAADAAKYVDKIDIFC